MKAQFKLVSALLASQLMGSPLGERAHYTIDKDPNRTSSMIKSGSVDAVVAEHQTAAYRVDLNYKFQIQFLGTQSGTEPAVIDEAYFAPAFLEELRKTQHYEGPNFKVDHTGFADAKNLDGEFYAHCDRLRFYEIKSLSRGLFWVASSLLLGNFRADIENLVVVAHLFPGIPVLGAVKIDMSGTYQGRKVKAGGDYVTP